ncbi:MAG: ATP-binding protein [Halanaeroarchaeum sp.]
MTGPAGIMTFVLGRSDDAGPTGTLGHFLATDGSRGAPVSFDLDRPHVGLVVGKRGSGKSHTLGVLAEEIAGSRGVGGVVVDPMGAFEGLEEHPAVARIASPRVRAEALPPDGWCRLLDIDPTSGPGALLWRAAAMGPTLANMRTVVETAGAPPETRRAVLNHLALADRWDVFDGDARTTEAMVADGVTVLDVSGIPRQARAAIVFAVARGLYDRAHRDPTIPLPWLLVDEAHAVTNTVAADPLRTLLTRGRQPGVSLVLATQRPAALPEVAISQSDLLLSHRLTAGPDVDALARTNPTYLDGDLAASLPDGTGQALVVDDATESAVTIQVRERETPHGGDTPRATDRRHDGSRPLDGVPAGPSSP